MKKLKEQMFDFEVYPNWWCCVLGKYPDDDDIPESVKDEFTVVTSDDATPRNLARYYDGQNLCEYGLQY